MSESSSGRYSSSGSALQMEMLERRHYLSTWSEWNEPWMAGHEPPPPPLMQIQDHTGGTGISPGMLPDVRFAQTAMGLLGSGQTVVVIDSGIAYDHVALGGGLGTGFRVVGGWDFAENDANPYDDAPGGLHGTFVAGVIGSSDIRYPGMAPQVDLVALRVFDDQGNSTFDLLERALQWTYAHRTSFTHPITTVNISIGTNWNSSQVPTWSRLEDEFAALHAAGILVTASAGNSFQQYQQPGLTYPAASPYVLPVGSVGASGNLSSFTQRHTRMVAALGEWVTSTAPDYLFGFNGITDDFVEMNGTSVSAPIVAGATVLLRETAQQLGQQMNVSDITSLLRSSADPVFDPLTNSNYLRMNLRRALTTLVGADEYGGPQLATAIGFTGNEIRVSGILQTVQDQDSIQFVAPHSGRMRVQLTWSGRESQRPALTSTVGPINDAGEFLVQAGQTVVLTTTAHGGIGRFDLAIRSMAQPELIPAASSFAESRVRWTAESTGPQLLTATFLHPGSVHELVIQTAAGQILARRTQPQATESIVLHMQHGMQYEAIVRGEQAQAIFELSGQGNRWSSDDDQLATMAVQDHDSTLVIGIRSEFPFVERRDSAGAAHGAWHVRQRSTSMAHDRTLYDIACDRDGRGEQMILAVARRQAAAATWQDSKELSLRDRSFLGGQFRFVEDPPSELITAIADEFDGAAIGKV